MQSEWESPWELVREHPETRTLDVHRLRVPSGWLYRYSGNLTFVPLPAGSGPSVPDFLDHKRRIVTGPDLGVLPAAPYGGSGEVASWGVVLPMRRTMLTLVAQVSGDICVHEIQIDGIALDEVRDLMVMAPGLRIPLFLPGRKIAVTLSNADVACAQVARLHLEVAI